MGGRGRGRSSRTQRKHFKQSRENVWKRTKQDPPSDSNGQETKENQSWHPLVIENPAFDDYYKEQGIVSPEEWDVFMETLKKPLPAAFRINSSSQFSEDIRSQLQDDFMQSLQAEAVEEGEAEAIKPLPWYPDNLAWHSNFSRRQIRKNQTLERFHEFLKLENEIGNITRQEAVSMVPPLFLDVRPDHFVLDMCAAPGSKTFQLLEIIYQSTKPGSLPHGMVIANDLDVQRCNLLIHQTKRMCTANLIVTNHEAQHFPGCRSIRNFLNGSEIANRTDPSISQLLFDRVLCDVPCSGDGTLRKAPDLWRKWNFGMGNGLHSLQILIAMRGISLLKVGGKMVYSTCSMNPVENEAVVTEILRRSGGSVELVDVSDQLPPLIRRPGLQKWKVRDKGVWLASYRDVPEERKSSILPSMFPSGRSSMDAIENNDKTEDAENIDSANKIQDADEPMILNDSLKENLSDLPLERCMRIVPQDQNTGAFFIAVLQKLSALPAVQDNAHPEGTLCAGLEEPHAKVSSQVVEEASGMEVNPVNDSEEKISEAASNSDLVENEPNGVDRPNRSGAVPMPAEKKIDSGNARGKRKLQNQGKWKGVDPVVFLNNDIVINSIKTFYGIDESFPFSGHLITRNYDTSSVKRIYYVSKSVKDVLELNFRVGHPLKITSIGLKMFERQSSREGSSAPCAFRISSEGLPLILPYITKQILYASPVDFKHLLEYKTIKFGDFVDSQFGKEAENLMMGCCVIVLKEADEVLKNPFPSSMPRIAIGCWRGKASLSVMVTAMDCKELLERLILRMENGKGNQMPENIIEGEKTLDANGTEKDTIILDQDGIVN